MTWPFSAEKFKMHTYDEVSLYCPSLPTTFHQLFAFNFQTCLTWYGSNRVHVELIALHKYGLGEQQLKFKLHRYNLITFLRWKTTLWSLCAVPLNCSFAWFNVGCWREQLKTVRQEQRSTDQDQCLSSKRCPEIPRTSGTQMQESCC